MNAFVKITSLKLIRQRKSMTDLQQRERAVLTLVTQIVNRVFKVLGGYFKKHSPSLPLPLWQPAIACNHYDITNGSIRLLNTMKLVG